MWGSQLMVATVRPQIGASLRLVYSAPPLSGFLGALARYSARPRLPSQCHNHTATPIMKATDPGAVDPRSHHEAVRTMGNETRAIQMAVSSDLEGVVTLLNTRR